MQQCLVGRNAVRAILVVVLACWSATSADSVVQAQRGVHQTQVRVVTREGKVLEGTTSLAGLNLGGVAARSLENKLLSINLAGEPSSFENQRIAEDILIIQGNERARREAAVAELTEFGLVALTPVLNAYKDRDLREPDPLYRLFSRLIPGPADQSDRSLDLIRLKPAGYSRQSVTGRSLPVRFADGTSVVVPTSSIRSLAIRQAVIDKQFELHSLRHSTQIEFLDTGIVIGAGSRVKATAAGFVRLSFAVDGWASDADGLKVPGPNYKTNLVDGFPFGAVVGKVGAAGPRFLVGKQFDMTSPGSGRLYLAVNDNAHWQNNIGSFRVTLRVTDAYDVGDAQ